MNLKPKTFIQATVVLVLVVFVCWLWWWCYLCPVSSLLLIRHAEKAAEPPPDPPLTPAGQARAQTLVHVAGSAGISMVFATEFQRTQQTVAPLVAALGLTPTILNASEVDALVSQLRSVHDGRVVLVVGHTNTIPQIIEKLGGGSAPTIAESEFDNLFVLTLYRCSKARFVRLKYGNAS